MSHLELKAIKRCAKHRHIPLTVRRWFIEPVWPGPIQRGHGAGGYCNKAGEVKAGALRRTPTNLLAFIIAHEMGHVEANREAGVAATFGPQTEYETFLIECDAWERALRLWGELGLALTPELCYLALECLLSYRVFPEVKTEESVERWLLEKWTEVDTSTELGVI